MVIEEVITANKIAVVVEQATDGDYVFLTKKRFFFAWNRLKGKLPVYKLTIKGNTDILGVMAIIDIPGEQRIEINLLACSVENIGKRKTYDRIAGCLIAWAGRMGVEKYGALACVSLVPKTELAPHYVTKYNMKRGGRHLYLDGKELLSLLNTYL